MSFTNRNHTLMTQQSGLSYSQPPEPRLSEDSRSLSQMFPEQKDSYSASFTSTHPPQEQNQSEVPAPEEPDHYSVYEKRRTTLKKESDIAEFEEQLRNSTQKGSQFKRKSDPQEEIISPNTSNVGNEISVKDLASYPESKQASVNKGQSESHIVQLDRNTNVSSHSKTQSLAHATKPSNTNVFVPSENSSLSIKNEQGQSRITEGYQYPDAMPRTTQENLEADGSVRDTSFNDHSRISQTQKLSSAPSRQTNQSVDQTPEEARATLNYKKSNISQQNRSQIQNNMGSHNEIDEFSISNQNPSIYQQTRAVQGRQIEYSMSAKESDLGPLGSLSKLSTKNHTSEIMKRILL